MKIYEIGTGYTPIPAQISAATEIVVEELTKAFRKMDVPVEIVDIAASNRTVHNLPIREVNVPNAFSGTDVQLGFMHKLKRVVYSVALASELKSLLRKEEGKVVLHFHNQYNLFFFYKLVPVKLQKKAIIAYTNHSGVWRLPWADIENVIKKRYFQEAFCMKHADMVFVLNEETKDNIKKHLGVCDDRIVVIGNGVNTDVYIPMDEKDKLEAKQRWGFTGKKVILQVGSVYENKGQLRTVMRMLPLLKKDRELIFAYAGGIVSEEYHSKVREYAEANGIGDQVCYLGMIKPGVELNRLYNAADATMFASEYEGFSLVIIESLASGTPVLVDRSSPFYVGEGCILYCADTFQEDLMGTVFSNQNNDYTAVSAAARKTAEEQYGWSVIANRYIQAFTDKEDIPWLRS